MYISNTLEFTTFHKTDKELKFKFLSQMKILCTGKIKK